SPPPAETEVMAALTPDPSLPLSAAHTDVVLAIVCTFRKDRLQAYGQTRDTSPFLARLAANGVAFERTITQASWTRPSVGSMLTGLWPGVLQLDDPSDRGFHNRSLSAEATTLSEILEGAGYRALGISGNPNVSSTFGFDQGFAVYHEPEVLWRDEQGPPPSGGTLVQQLLEDLDASASDQRVYLQALFVDTHAPRHPTLRARRAIERGEEGGDVSERVRRYDAALRTLDGHLADLFVEVQRRRPNLLFVVIGDHGEGLDLPPGHGPGHGNHLYTTTTDVPFLIWHPALPQPGRRVDGLAMGVDLLPTILELLGLPVPGQLDGLSQAGAVLGRTSTAAHEKAFSETLFRKSDKTAVMADGWHLIRDRKAGGEERLYHLSEPLEVSDHLADQPEVRARLGAELDAWEARVRAAAEASGPPVEALPSKETLHRLEMLGYLD
ncbi:MAG: sulfatase-like hydrolase/transferase, partial [Deltaproteobacteria bacterium]|nr:sulfatase-like hydrolase/transferase [Deltaproteobacteria bacterium]